MVARRNTAACAASRCGPSDAPNGAPVCGRKRGLRLDFAAKSVIPALAGRASRITAAGRGRVGNRTFAVAHAVEPGGV